MMSGTMVLAAFFQGTPAYNFVNLSVGVASLVLTIASMVAAIRASRSASAAQVEAGKVRRVLQGVTAGVELRGLRGFIREAVSSLESGGIASALGALTFVREELSRWSRLPIGRRLSTPQEWRNVDRELGDVADVLRQAHAVEPPPGRLETAEIVSRLLEVGVTVARMQADAEAFTAVD